MYDIFLKGKYKRNCKAICMKAQQYFKDNTEAIKYEFTENIIGNISCQLVKNDIEINFLKIQEQIKIFKESIVFKSTKTNTQIIVYNEEKLRELLNDQEKNYYFYNDVHLITSEEIIKNRPTLITLVEKDEISYEFFSPLNEKGEIPINTNVISIKTNCLSAINISSLNLARNTNFSMIVPERNKLIKILNEFLISKYKILKVYGSDGIGKSMSFIYYAYLKNDYKILYFNLKEIKLAHREDKFNIIIFQLLNYYAEKFEKEEGLSLEEQKQIAYQNYLDKSNEIKNELNRRSEFDFWYILEKLINFYNFEKKVLIILDQYRAEDYKSNSLQKIENLLAYDQSKSNIKLLVSSSINDFGVKEDFKLYLCALYELNEGKNINNNKTSNNALDNSKENQYDIDILNRIKNDSINKENLKYLINDNYSERKKLIKDDIVQIIYINELVSVENLNDENQEQIKKMKDFNYNPKYFRKFKDFSSQNLSSFGYDDIYIYFITHLYKDISEKIKIYYRNYFKNSEETSLLIMKKIMDIRNLIDKKNAISFPELIQLLDQIPFKYIKILTKEENKVTEKKMEIEREEKKNIIIFNNNLLRSKFELDYAFPFIKYVLARLTFDLEVILFKGVDPSGSGSILEKEIKKAIFTYKSYKNFNYRTVYSFLNSDKTNIDEKYKTPEIDIFNFKELILDDIQYNPLIEKMYSYYIVPKLTNNPSLDSSILIPHKTFDENNMNYSLVSLQISINKKNLKTLEEYCKSTLEASKLFEKIYKIKIINKYFIFVLCKEYNNKTTQDSLENSKIPYIFYSLDSKKFHTIKNETINDISQLLQEQFKIIDKPIEEEIIGNKKGNFRSLEMLLQRKRLINKTTNEDDDYLSEREKIFPNDQPINLPIQIEKNIENHMKTLLNTKILKIKYAFVSPLYKVDSLLYEHDLFGLIFYKGLIFILYKGIIHGLSDQNRDNAKVASDLEKKIVTGLDYKDEYGQTYNKEKNYDNLMKYNKYQPSSIYVYYLHKQKEKK